MQLNAFVNIIRSVHDHVLLNTYTYLYLLHFSLWCRSDSNIQKTSRYMVFPITDPIIGATLSSTSVNILTHLIKSHLQRPYTVLDTFLYY